MTTTAGQAQHNGRVTAKAAPPERHVRLLRAVVQFHFIVDGGGDDIEERAVPASTFSPREWSAFMGGGYRKMIARFEEELVAEVKDKAKPASKGAVDKKPPARARARSRPTAPKA